MSETVATDRSVVKVSNTKALGGGLGAGIGLEINNILMYLVQVKCGIRVPDSVEESFGVILVALVAYLAVYMSPANK